MINIPRKIQLPQLTKSESKAISDSFFYSDKLSDINKLDLLIVFGVSNQLTDCTRFLKSLLKYDFEGTIIISGGVRKPGSKSEAKQMYEALKNHLKNQSVILEERSTNTYENIVFSLRKIDLREIEAVGIVNSTLNSYRAFLTIKKYLINYPIEIFRFSYAYVDRKKNSKEMIKTNWFEDEDYKQRIASEIKRIIVYGKKADLDYKLFKNSLPESLINKFKV